MGASVDKLLFQPPTPPSYTATPNFFPLRTATNKTIHAFFVSVEKSKFTILFSHGNAEDLGMIFEWFKEIALQLQCNVMAYDYTGYGLSDGGPPSEKHCFENIQAAFDFLTETQGLMPDEIILYGRSLGSGASCELARRQSDLNAPVRGVILQSPLMSAYRVAFHFRYSMPGDMMCNIDKVPFIKSSVFIIHGKRDEIVPFYHGEELYLGLQPQYRYSPYWVDEAGHNNIEVMVQRRHKGAFFDRLREFVAYLEKHPNGKEDLAIDESLIDGIAGPCCSKRADSPLGDDDLKAMLPAPPNSGEDSSRA